MARLPPVSAYLTVEDIKFHPGYSETFGVQDELRLARAPIKNDS